MILILLNRPELSESSGLPLPPLPKKALRSAPAEVDRGAAGAVHHGCLHTRVVAGGLAASSPLTWHVLLRFAGAGRDHVEDLGGAPVGRAVGSLGDAVGQLRPRRAGDVLSFIHDVSFSLRCSGVLAFKSWREKKYVSSEPPLFFLQQSCSSAGGKMWLFGSELLHYVHYTRLKLQT